MSIALIAALAIQATVHDTCDVGSAAFDTVEQSCTETVSSTGRTTYRVGSHTYVVELLQRQGQWAHARINGQPAMRYEIYRDSYVYTTDDLSLTLDVRSDGSSKYPRGD